MEFVTGVSRAKCAWVTFTEIVVDRPAPGGHGCGSWLALRTG